VGESVSVYTRHCSTSVASRQTIILRSAALFFDKGPRMIAERDNYKLLDLSPPPAWAEVWHLWTVMVPRRSITGRLVFGQVWRRRDGRHWIYKKFTEYAQDRAE
jgi:hypothetical protein